MLRHNLTFVFEDAGMSGVTGLRAYESLIRAKHVDFLIGGTSSNGTMAAAPLINQSRTVLVTPLTGGSNIDGAGEWIFRIGNSDVLNGEEEAELFEKKGYRTAALVTEQTEYSEDVSKSFLTRFEELGGKVVVEEHFAPGTDDFRALGAKIVSASPQALFIPTQTGTALAIFLKQLHERSSSPLPVFTTFVAAENPDAKKLAGALFTGVQYMAPEFDENGKRYQTFLKEYKADHNQDPDIGFHTAGTVDALDLLQIYLDDAKTFSAEGFQKFLLNRVHDYSGLMGTYSLNEKGNSSLGFRPAQIEGGR